MFVLQYGKTWYMILQYLGLCYSVSKCFKLDIALSENFYISACIYCLSFDTWKANL